VWFPHHDHLVDLRRRELRGGEHVLAGLDGAAHQPADGGFENTARDVEAQGEGLACGTDGDVFEVAAGLGEIGQVALDLLGGNEQARIAQPDRRADRCRARR